MSIIFARSHGIPGTKCRWFAVESGKLILVFLVSFTSNFHGLNLLLKKPAISSHAIQWVCGRGGGGVAWMSSVRLVIDCTEQATFAINFNASWHSTDKLPPPPVRPSIVQGIVPLLWWIDPKWTNSDSVSCWAQYERSLWSREDFRPLSHRSTILFHS